MASGQINRHGNVDYLLLARHFSLLRYFCTHFVFDYPDIGLASVVRLIQIVVEIDAIDLRHAQNSSYLSSTY